MAPLLSAILVGAGDVSTGDGLVVDLAGNTIGEEATDQDVRAAVSVDAVALTNNVASLCPNIREALV